MKRRSFLAAGAGAAFTAALAACGDSDSSAAPAASVTTKAGPFEYKDALGKTVSLAGTPSVVVAQSSVAAALWDAGFKVAGAYGELKPDTGGKLSYQAGSLDISRVKVIGSTYGEFDVEKYALMNPQLLIDYTFDDKSLWYVPEAQSKKILSLAPSVAVPGNYATTDEAITTFVDLAGKLGADTSAQSTAKAGYDTALKSVASVAASAGLKVVVMSPGTDSLYVANPAYLPELTTLKKQGLDVMDPVNADKQVFTQYSWEKAPDYSQADVILVDARGYDAAKADLAKISVWAHLPAVKANQVYYWFAAAPYSYASYTKIYSELATQLGGFKKL